MKRNFRLAFNALKKINAPVYERCDIENFQISAEHNFDLRYGNKLWASMYENINGWDFGINPEIDRILDKYALHAEWINAGEVGVYEN